MSKPITNTIQSLTDTCRVTWSRPFSFQVVLEMFVELISIREAMEFFANEPLEDRISYKDDAAICFEKKWRIEFSCFETVVNIHQFEGPINVPSGLTESSVY